MDFSKKCVVIFTSCSYILDTRAEVEERVPEPMAAAPIMAATTGWDDPTEVNWGAEEEEEKDEPIVPEPKEAIFKCTALYSYTVSILFNILRTHNLNISPPNWFCTGSKSR